VGGFARVCERVNTSLQLDGTAESRNERVYNKASTAARPTAGPTPPMGIVLGIIAIAEAIADTLAAAGAVAATLTEAAAFAIALAIPELDIAGISSLAGVALDTGVDAAVDEGASALLQGAGRLLARKVLTKMVDKGVEKTYSNLLKIYTKTYAKTAKVVKKIKTVHLLANAALNTCCLPNSGCSKPLHLKCASESASASFRGGDVGFLRAGGAANSSSAWPHSLNHLGATTDLTFPMTQMCGETTRSVDSLAAATHCYEQTLRNLQLKVEMSSGWRSVSQHACNIVLFGATPTTATAPSSRSPRRARPWAVRTTRRCPTAPRWRLRRARCCSRRRPSHPTACCLTSGPPRARAN
jgi:hypothetical protein